MTKDIAMTTNSGGWGRREFSRTRRGGDLMSRDTDAGSPLSRRGLLKGMVTTGLASTLDPLTHALAELAPRQRDLIKAENEKSGTTDWLLKSTRVDPKT